MGEGPAHMFWEIPENKLTTNKYAAVVYIWTSITFEAGGLSHRCPKGEQLTEQSWLLTADHVNSHSPAWFVVVVVVLFCFKLPCFPHLPTSSLSSVSKNISYLPGVWDKEKKKVLRGTALVHWKAFCNAKSLLVQEKALAQHSFPASADLLSPDSTFPFQGHQQVPVECFLSQQKTLFHNEGNFTMLAILSYWLL